MTGGDPAPGPVGRPTGPGAEHAILERATRLRTGRFAVGVEILPERIVAVLTDHTGDRVGKRRRTVVEREPRPLAREIAKIVRGLVSTELGLELADGNVVVGIQIGAPVDSGTGTVLHYRNPSSGSGLAWPEPVPLAEYVRDETGCRVAIENDAASYAVYEQKRGVHETSSFALILMRDGIGAAVVLNDRVLPCPLEVGHLIVSGGGRDCRCGRSGCIESVAGRRAITENHADRVGGRAPAEFAHLAAQSDPTVAEVFRQAGEAVAQGIAALVTLFGVELVILYHDRALAVTGDAGTAAAAFREGVDTFRHYTFPPLSHDCRLETKSLPDTAGAHGAAVVALHRLSFVPLT